MASLRMSRSGSRDQQAERLQGFGAQGRQRLQRRTAHLGLGAVHIHGEPADGLGLLVPDAAKTAGAITTTTVPPTEPPPGLDCVHQNRHVMNALISSDTRLPVSLIPSRPVPGRIGAGLSFG